MAITIRNFQPVGQYVSPATSISFDVTSSGSPIDLSTLDVRWTETGDFVIIDGSFQDGYFGSISATTASGEAGYHIEINAPRYHYNTPVSIKVTLETNPTTGILTAVSETFRTTNYFGSIIAESGFFVSSISSSEIEVSGLSFSARNNNVLYQLNDASEPVITNRIPPANQTGVLRNTTTTINFGIHDRGQEGVDLGTLQVYIQDIQYIQDGFFVAPYTGSTNSSTIDTFPGYSVTINLPSLFPYSTVVEVRVVVKDAAPDPAAVNTLDVTYSFTIEPYIDVTGPSPSPTVPPTGFDPRACIEFDWLDEPFGDGPDFFTLNVTIRRELTIDCITDITDDIAVVNGIATPGYELFATSLTVGDQIGYHVILCPFIPFNENEIITVIINGQDTLGNDSSGSFNISTSEIQPPVILNLDPASGATEVDPEETVYFEIHDQGGSGVDPNKLTVLIDDSEAIIDGVFQPGFSGSIVSDRVVDEFTLDFDGYKVSINRDVPFTPGREISVEIDGYDAYGNLAVELYSFTVSPDVTPPTFVIDPPYAQTGNNRDQIITIDVLDKIGVNPNSVNINIADQQAVLNGVAVAPFDVTVTQIITTPGVIDGYRYSVDTENDFAFNQVVNISVIAQDAAGNQSADTSFFRTFSDVVSPTISDISPRDTQREVSLRPEISFTMRDAYDIAFNLLYVDIDEQPAVRNGLVQSNFSMSTVRISGGTLGVDPGDGYVVIITPDEDFPYNHTVTVSISVYDLSENNNTTATATWTTVNPRPPVFDIIPGPDDQEVAVDTDFTFEVFSDGYKVDINTLALYIDGQQAINSGIVDGVDFVGTIETILDGYHYRGTIDPRFILSGSSVHTVNISAREPISDNIGVLNYTFSTAAGPENPKTLYLGTSDGVRSIRVSEIQGNGTSAVETVFDGYFVHDIFPISLNYINRLIVGTRDHGAMMYSTNYSWTTLFYSSGDEIIKVAATDKNNGTLYLANRTRSRVDVYYNVLYDNSGRNTPDVYYGIDTDSEDGYAIPGMNDGYFTDMVVTADTSIVKDGSSSIFLGTPSGVFRIETDESVLGNTEINGTLTSYGVYGSGREYGILEGTSSKVVAIDVNTELNYLYVATRDDEGGSQNAITYIDLATNKRTSFIPEARLINRYINDISMKNRKG